MKIVEFVKILEKRPIISAFTATATETVREDIVCIVRAAESCIGKRIDREKICFFRWKKPKDKEQYILKYIFGHSGDSGIIYCDNKEKR